MLTVYNRVADWNSKRYDQEFNLQLTVSLLTEELEEFLEAQEPVDELDALCDLTYLAMGGLWKLDKPLNPEVAVRAIKAVESLLDQGIILHPITLLAAVVSETEYDPEAAMYKVIAVATLLMLHFGFDQEQCEEAMLIVCDSNDSKTIKKTASNVKANVDKGSYFVPPEPRLQALLDSVSKEVKH